MFEYRETLRRLAISDPRFLSEIMGRDNVAVGEVEARVVALLRLAALMAIGGPSTAFGQAVTMALAAGATEDDVAATLVAVAPVVGSARTVETAPKVALAMGYDVEADLEAWPEFAE